MYLRGALVVTAVLAWPGLVSVQTPRLNPMVGLHERVLPVFGITHPAIVTPTRGPAAASAAAGAPLPPLLDAARELVAYEYSDFAYTNYNSTQADRFTGFVGALLRVGASIRTQPFLSKVPIVHTDPSAAIARIHEQLDLGHAGVMLQEVESADEIRTALSAMRFAAKGGTRPDTGIGLAAAYWGLSEADYRRKADPWPLNRDGELVLWAIVESRAGIERVREIAAVPGLTVLTVGAGTLSRVFSTTAADGSRTLDKPGFDAAVARVAAACKEFKVACSHPANTAAEIDALMAQGFSVFTMQSRNDAAFGAIAAGRGKAGRPVPPSSRE